MSNWEMGASAYDGPDHRSLWFAGDRPAAVLLHGLPGTPAELRPIAEALHRAGWTVRVPLLPGFGADLGTLPGHEVSAAPADRRRAEWVAAARAEWRLLGEHHTPLLLLGYSTGAALALAVAEQEPVPALALVAPVPRPTSLLTRGTWPLVRRLRREVDPHPYVPIAWDVPTVPTRLLDELLRLGAEAGFAATTHSGSSLVVSAGWDPLTTRRSTLGLIDALAGPVRFQELDGYTDFVTPDRPGHDALLTAVTRFAWDAWEPHAHRRLPQLGWG